ncbi:MAG: DUF58 domain-containing protein [Myxococcota bacterium]
MIGFLPRRPLILASFIPLALAFPVMVAPELWAPLLVVDATLLGVALLDLGWSRRALVRLDRSVDGTASLSRPFSAKLSISNESERALNVEIQLDLFSEARCADLPLHRVLRPRSNERIHLSIRSEARGPKAIGDHFVRYPSRLGLWTRQLRLPAADEVHVYPDLMAARRYDLVAKMDRTHALSRLARHRGGETEFERLRDHTRDDELRRVDWRASARRGKLTVRDYQIEQNQNVVCMVDCGRLMTTRWAGHTGLDHALNAVLMLSQVAVRRGDRAGLIAFGERVERVVVPTGGRTATQALARATYDLFPRMVEPAYEEAFRTLQIRVRRRSLVVLLTHALDDQTAERIQGLCAELIPRHIPLVALLQDSDIEERARSEATGTDLFVQAAAIQLRHDRRRALEGMRQRRLLVVEVAAPDLTSAVVARYLEVKARGII